MPRKVGYMVSCLLAEIEINQTRTVQLSSFGEPVPTASASLTRWMG